MLPELEVVREWLVKAGDDLELARRALSGTPVPWGACFHRQQAAEKALKAFLESRQVRPPKTHILAELFDLAQQLDPRFERVRDVEWLSTFAVAGRYPGFESDLAVEAAREALRDSTSLLEFVCGTLPAEAQP